MSIAPETYQPSASPTGQVPAPESSAQVVSSIPPIPIASQPPSAKIITVNGVEYLNPQQQQTLQQPDGSSFTIGSDFIDYGGNTYSFRSVTSKTTLVSGAGGDIAVEPAATSTLVSKGGLLDALKDLSHSAGNLFNSLEGLQQDASSWAAGQMSDAKFLSMFPGDLASGLAIGKPPNLTIALTLLIYFVRTPRYESINRCNFP